MKKSFKPGTMIYPLPAVLVSCGATPEEYNVLTVAWTGTVCSDPPMCYVSIRPSRYSYDIIKRNGIDIIRDKLHLPGYIPNSDLPYIYNDAFAFLYTSLRESFGIPLLEGMACGTPVITSNTSSMPEIGGMDAILVNPENADEIADMLLKLENDEAFYNEKRAVGLQRAQLFSWRRTAEQLLSLYQYVAR